MSPASPDSARVVLFWDIDGTLLTTARAGVFALEEAAREVCGAQPDFQDMPTAGLTDSEVARLAIETVGLDATSDRIAAFLRVYEEHLPDRLSWRQGRVLDGVVPILEDLAPDPSVLLLLLTGNTPAGAAAKLSHYGLDRYFRGGAFSADGDDREAIARRALLVAAEIAGHEINGPSAVVIGDTPHDIRCGKAIAARTVAVASGTYSAQELSALGATHVLTGLPGPAGFRDLLGL